MTDTDTARRQRAETDALAWVRRSCTVEEIRVQEAGLVRGYLAGAREEAAIKDAEIETLRTTYDSLALHCTQRETLLQSLIALRNEQTTEIAALRASCDEWRSRASNKATDNMDLRAEIAALRAECERKDADVEAGCFREQRLADHLAGALKVADEQRAEIAALREFVSWHFMHHPQSWPGNAEIMPAVRRALKERP